MPRITIDFDERASVAGEGASLPVADVAAAIDGGAAPVGETEGLGAGATGDATAATAATDATAALSAKAKKSEKVADIASGTKRTRTKAQATKAASAAPKEQRRRKSA